MSSILAGSIARVSALSGVDLATIEQQCRVRGAILAVAELHSVCSVTVDVSPTSTCGCGPWAVPGQYHPRFTGVRMVADPVKAAGTLGLWHVPASVAQAVRNQLRMAARE